MVLKTQKAQPLFELKKDAKFVLGMQCNTELDVSH